MVPLRWLASIVGDLAAPNSLDSPAAGATQPQCGMKFLSTTAMHADSLHRISMGPGNALRSADPCVVARHRYATSLDVPEVSWRIYAADLLADHNPVH